MMYVRLEMKAFVNKRDGSVESILIVDEDLIKAVARELDMDCDAVYNNLSEQHRDEFMTKWIMFFEHAPFYTIASFFVECYHEEGCLNIDSGINMLAYSPIMEWSGDFFTQKLK